MLLFVGIPIFALVYAVCIPLFKVKSLSNTAKWGLLILWIISVIFCGVYIYYANINGWGFDPFHIII